MVVVGSQMAGMAWYRPMQAFMAPVACLLASTIYKQGEKQVMRRVIGYCMRRVIGYCACDRAAPSGNTRRYFLTSYFLHHRECLSSALLKG